MNSSVADEIRDLRRAGLTVREIAARVGKSYQWVSKVTHAMERPTFTVSIDSEGRTVVTSDLDPRLLATHVVKALARTADVTYVKP